jgi:hypothetical protein
MAVATVAADLLEAGDVGLDLAPEVALAIFEVLFSALILSGL